MKTGELSANREELIKWIKNLKNEKLLNFLNILRLSEKSTKSDWWNDLTEAEINDINQGLEEIENGDTISSEEFWNQLRS